MANTDKALKETDRCRPILPADSSSNVGVQQCVIDQEESQGKFNDQPSMKGPQSR